MKSSARIRITLSLLFLLMTPNLWAQLDITVALVRNSYVRDEPVVVEIKVTNRAGKALALGGPGGQSWLMIDLKRGDGTVVHAVNGEPKFDSTMIKSGESLIRTVSLGNYYSIDEATAYLVSCSVYFPDLQRWLPGNKALFNVNSPKVAFWERAVGLPATHPKSNRYRRFRLFTNKSMTRGVNGNLEQSLLYVRITDEETGDNVATFPLGPLLTYINPQPATDRDGNLNILYMCAPQLFQYVVLDADGKIKSERIYQAAADTPTLMATPDGSMSIRGGKIYDPQAEIKNKKAEQSAIKSLKDRPLLGP